MSHYGYVSEQLLAGELFPTGRRDQRRRGWLSRRREPRATTGFDVERMRSHFDFPATGRVVTNNAATTQTPRELVDLYRRLSPWYESVHRGQSAASEQMTATFEESFDTIATWINAPSRAHASRPTRNTTEAINAVMYSLLTEFRDGDNVVTTLMEHNSNFVPWYALSHEVLPRLRRRVECRLVRFDHETGELDLEHLAELVDDRTKLVCVTGASNFLGTRPPLDRVRQIAAPAAIDDPDGDDGLAAPRRRRAAAPDQHHRRGRRWTSTTSPSPSTRCSRRSASGSSTRANPCSSGRCPFLYGGDMIAEGKVSPGRVELQPAPLEVRRRDPERARGDRLGAGTPAPGRPGAGSGRAVVRQPAPLARADVESAMGLVNRARARPDRPSDRARAQASRGSGSTGQDRACRRSPLLAFTVPAPTRAGGVRPGRARHRLAAYTSDRDVDRAMTALTDVVRSG